MVASFCRGPRTVHPACRAASHHPWFGVPRNRSSDLPTHSVSVRCFVAVMSRRLRSGESCFALAPIHLLATTAMIGAAGSISTP